MLPGRGLKEGSGVTCWGVGCWGGAGVVQGCLSDLVLRITSFFNFPMGVNPLLKMYYSLFGSLMSELLLFDEKGLSQSCGRM